MCSSNIKIHRVAVTEGEFQSFLPDAHIVSIIFKEINCLYLMPVLHNGHSFTSCDFIHFLEILILYIWFGFKRSKNVILIQLKICLQWLLKQQIYNSVLCVSIKSIKKLEIKSNIHPIFGKLLLIEYLSTTTTNKIYVCVQF